MYWDAMSLLIVHCLTNQKIPKYGHGDVLWMGKCLRISIFKRQKFEKIFPGKVGWQSFKLDLALAQ